MEGEDRAVLMAAVDPAGCTVQPLIVGAPVPPDRQKMGGERKEDPRSL